MATNPNEVGGWVIDKNNPLRATYTDEDGTTYEAFKEPEGVPLIGGERPASQKAPELNTFDESIQRQGGWGLSSETRRALGADNPNAPEVLRPLTDLPGNVADIGFRGLQGVQAGLETAGQAVDKVFDKTGIADALSFDGNKFHPGEAFLALMEAFPTGGLEAGMMPHIKAPERTPDLAANPLQAERAAYASEQALQAQAKALFDSPTSTRADFDALAQEHGRGAWGPELDDALNHRDRATQFVASQVETAAKEKFQALANEENARASGDLFKAQLRDPDTPKSVDEAVAHVTDVVSDWANPPRIEIADDFANLADEGLRNAIDKDAIGVTTPDGKVLINMKNVADEAKARGVTQEDILSAVIFHEALGHYGLAQQFGNDLDAILLNLYHDNKGSFKGKVDEWMDRNPDAYGDDINPLARATEEVLAEMSENGRIDPTLTDAFRNWMKETGRNLGIDLKYSDREIKTILGMAHDAVLNGNGRDVTSNGFRYARAYHGTGETFDKYDNDKTGAYGFAEKGATYFDSNPKNADTYAQNALKRDFGTIPDTKPQFDRMLEIDKKYPDWENAPADIKKEYARLEKQVDDALNGGEEPKQNIRPVDIDLPDDAFLKVDAKGGRILKDVREAALRKAKAEGKRGVLFENAIDTATNVRRDGSAPEPSSVYALFDANADSKPGFGVRYMKRSVGKGSEAPLEDISRRQARDEDLSYTGVGPYRSKNNLSGILEEGAPTLSKESWNDWIDGADKVRSAASKAKNLKAGATPSEVLSARESIIKSANRIAELSRKAVDGNITERETYLLQAEMARNADMQDALAGVRSNAARVVNSFKIAVDSDEAFADAVRNMMRQTGNSVFSSPQNFQQLTQQVAQLSQNPAAVNKLLKAAVRPKAEDYIFRVWYNMMLSSPATHVANVVGTGGNFLADLLENTGAAVIGQRGRLSNADRIRGREVAYRVYGAMAALRDAQTYKRTMKAFDTATTGNQNNIKAGGSNVYVGPNKAAKAASYVFEGPTRALAAQDEGWRNILSLSNIYGLAVRNAGNKGLTGKAFWNEVENLINNPTKEMIDATNDYTKVLQFMDKPSKIAKSIIDLQTPGKDASVAGRFASGALKLAVPFVNTPDSLIRTAIRRSPLGPLERENVKGWKAGGAERDKVAARLTMGSLFAFWVAQQAAEGNITGSGPSDPKKRQEWSAAHQENSIKVGGTSYTIAGLEPVSTNLIAIATLVERMQHGELTKEGYATGAAKAAAGLASVLTENSYMESVSDLFKAMGEGSSSKIAVANFLGSLASNVTSPAVVRKYNQMADPAIRDTTGDGSLEDRIKGRIQSGIPGLSENLPQRYNIYGKPQERNLAGPDMFSRTNMRMEQDDPVLIELDRLIDTTDKVVIGAPGKTNVKVNGVQKKLTAEEHQKYTQLSGYWIVESVRQEMATPEWQSMKDDEKIAVIKDITKDMRKNAREVLFQEDED